MKENRLLMRAARVAGIYAAVALVWIFVSTRLSAWMFPNLEEHEMAELVKGCFFVAVTAVLLFGLFRHENSRREAATAELQRHEKLLSSITDCSDDMIFVKDREGRTVFMNPAGRRIVGQSTEKIIGTTAVEAHGPEIGAGFLAVDLRVMESGKSETVETEITTAGGERRVFLTTKAPRLDENGQVTGLIGIAHEITGRKRAAAALARVNLQNELILGSAAEGILGLDLDGNHTFVNPAAATMLGCEIGEMLGRPSHSMWHHTKADGSPYPKDECQIYASYRDGVVHHVSSEVFWRKDGTSFPVDYASMPIFEQGRLAGAVVTFSDISEQRRAEEQLEHLSRFPAENPNPVLRMTARGLLEYANTAADILLPELGCAVGGTVNGEWQTHIRDALVKACPVRLEFQAGGRTFSANLAPVNQHGYVNLYCNDITDRKRAEETLLASEVRYRRLFESAKDGILILDAESGMVVDVNPFLVELLGLTREVFLGRKVWELGFLKDVIANQENFAELQAKEYIRYEDMALETADGRRIDVEFVSNVYAVDHTKVIQCNIRDISARVKAEAALRKSEERFRIVQELSPDGFTILRPVRDAQGRVVDFTWVYENAAVARLNGTDPNAVAGRRLLELFPGHRDSSFLNNYRQVAESGESCIFEDAYGGESMLSPVCFRIVVVPMGGDIAILAQDITERKRAEAEAQASAAEFRAMFEMAAIGIAQAEPRTGQWLRVNQKLCDITGYSADEMLRMKVPELTHPEDRQKDWEAFQRVVRGEAPDYRMEKRYVRKDGSLAWVNVNMTVLRDAAGTATRTMSTIEDITKRRRAMESQARLVAAVEQAAEVIMITDPAGRIEYVNPAFEKVTGYAREEAMGQNPRILKSGKHDAEFYRQMWATLTAGQPWSGRMIDRRKDGTPFEEEATISPILDTDGKIMNYVAVKRDITHEVELEGQMRQAQKMESIGQLAGGVAHDFNNILQAMLGYTEIVLKQTPADDARHDDLVEIQKTGHRAAELTRQLLAVSRQQNLDRRVTDINALIEDVNKMLRRVIGENIRIVFDLGRDLDRVLVDAGQIGQILLNLAVNARDAMPRGGRLSFKTFSQTFSDGDLAAHPGIRAGRFVCVAITDTGTGMPPEVLEKIFLPFFTTKGPGKGTGLGLATSYGIARQHEGWMDVYSEVGSGSAFKLYLPAVERADGPVEISAEQKTLPPEALKGAGQRILMVEDEDVIRNMTKRQLERNGYTVTAVADATAAVDQFVSNDGNFDLVLTDVMLPDISGLELLDDLLARKPGLRVLISSGYTDNEKRWPVILERKWPFIGKPYTAGELLAALLKIFAPA